MNLFDVPPTKQLDMFRQKLELFRRAGVSGALAKRLALREAGKKFKTKTKIPGHQLSWHFQTDLSGQKYLFKKEQKR